MGQDSSKAGDYRPPELPDGCVEVRISVYKLEVVAGLGLVNAMCGGICGAYHSGVVVLGQEWAYGGHEDQGKSGVYRSSPEMHPDYIFFRRLVMGHARMSKDEVMRRIKSLALSAEWCGPRYDLFERNCNHFTSDLCWALLGKRPPDWINVTADGLARTSRRLRTQRQMLQLECEQYAAQHSTPAAGAPAQGANGRNQREFAAQAPGALAFRTEFEAAFEHAWRQGIGSGLERARQCQEGQDPDRLKEQEERKVLLASGTAAKAAAAAAARAAREAEGARAKQQEAGLPAWDSTWMRLSTVLLRSWRQAASRGELGPEGEAERDRQVSMVLQVAGEAARVRSARIARSRRGADKLAANGT